MTWRGVAWRDVMQCNVTMTCPTLAMSCWRHAASLHIHSSIHSCHTCSHMTVCTQCTCRWCTALCGEWCVHVRDGHTSLCLGCAVAV